MLQVTRLGGLVALGLGSLLFVGCGSGQDVPELGAVSGTVTLGGQPLADAEVSFQPAKGRPSYGRTDDSGKYTLNYTHKHEGALIGTHTVRIRTFRESESDDDGNEIPGSPEKVPARYNVHTELTAEVKSGKNPPIDFPLEAEGEIIQPDEAELLRSDDDE